MLFLESGGPEQRQLDYANGPEVSGELLVRVHEASSGAVPGGRWIIAGQSLGGLFAMHAATRHPELVRAAVAQSPSLWWPTPESVWSPAPGWFEEHADSPTGGAPVLLEAGVLEAGVVGFTRHAAPLLQVRGLLIDSREHAGGHDVLQWQAMLPDALADAIAATEPATEPGPA
ncbi:alpha/beta fold hydrolase [Salana multivorans]